MSLRLFISLSICLFVTVYSQTQQISVPITIGGNEFTVRFRPDVVKVEDVAKQLCTENAEKLAITEANFAGCVNPVAEFFQKAVDRYASQRTMVVPVTIAGNEFNIRFRADLVSAVDVAKQLCTENASKIGVTEETLAECVNPVGEYLQNALNQYVAEKTMQIPLTVENKEYTLSFRPDITTAVEVSEQFCVQAAKEIGVTDETIMTCVRSVAEYVQKAVAQRLEARLLTIPLTVSNKEFTIRIQPDLESAIDAAAQICEGNGELIGVTKETAPACIRDIVQYIRQLITQKYLEAQKEAQAQSAQPAIEDAAPAVVEV